MIRFLSPSRTTPLDALDNSTVEKRDIGLTRHIAGASRDRHPAIRPLEFGADGGAALISQ
jgi:hypothetical protein